MNYKFILNGKEYSHDTAKISGKEILNLGEVSPADEYDLLKKIQGKEYEPILLDEIVDLSDPGIEHFVAEKRKELMYSFDDEKYYTMNTVLTPVQILQIHGLNPEHYYLKQLMKHREITYKNDLEKQIDMIGEPEFISCKNEPTTVSGR
ncbi:MAG: multiubiquitin domain-containing protein [Ignavibacteriales bacterium]|nr:multiubiquitin domain-containing protein [Ignavibacteriales bacterium]